MHGSILIRRLTGTGKGKEEHVETQEISFGSGPNNTVRYDATWDKGVSPRHARVWREPDGAWWVQDAGSSTGTYVNGQRVTTKRPVHGSTVIELGQGGPKVEIMLPQKVERQSSSGGVGKLLAAAAVLVLLGGGAWFFLKNSSTGGDTDERLQRMAKQYEDGIGLVIFANPQIGPNGTAWAVAPNLFATNAHIAWPVMNELKAGGAVYVAINKRPDQRYRVKAAIPHPDYFKDSRGIDGKGPATWPNDVGVLVIDGKVSTTLKRAPQTKFEQLDSGHRVAFLGFPMEDVQRGGVDPANPVATMQSGILTAVTDFWLAKSVPENRQLIQHNLPAAGGASGSPIFDVDGDVVGILSSGNVMAAMNFEKWAGYVNQIRGAQNQRLEEAKKEAAGKGKEEQEAIGQKLKETLSSLESIPMPITDMKRAPSAVLINYGQRIDMLEELLEMMKEAGIK